MEALEERASRDQSRVILERPGTVQSQPELVHRGQKALASTTEARTCQEMQ